MRVAALSVLLLNGCGQFQSGDQVGRYRQITPAEPISCDINRTPLCGTVILDSQTGTIFIREQTDWLEDNPHTGKLIVHQLDFPK